MLDRACLQAAAVSLGTAGFRLLCMRMQTSGEAPDWRGLQAHGGEDSHLGAVIILAAVHDEGLQQLMLGVILLQSSLECQTWFSALLGLWLC